jgi:hypothetical protein
MGLWDGLDRRLGCGTIAPFERVVSCRTTAAILYETVLPSRHRLQGFH